MELENSDPAGVLLDSSFSLIWLEECEKALDACNRAIEMKPDSANLYLNRGIALDGLGQYEVAIESYNQAPRFNENLHKI